MGGHVDVEGGGGCVFDGGVFLEEELGSVDFGLGWEGGEGTFDNIKDYTLWPG